MVQAVVASASKAWPTFVARGVLALILAVIAFAYPGQTSAVLTYAFGAYILLNGFAMLSAGLGFSSVRGSWFGLVLLGLVSIAAGIYMLAEPNVGALTLAYTIALWTIATGVFEIYAAVQAGEVISNTWIWAIVGVLSIAAGIIIAHTPGAGLVALSYTVGVYAALAGIASIVFGVRLRGLPDTVDKMAAHAGV